MAPRALLLFSSLALLSLSLSCCAASAAPAQCDPRGYCPSTCSRPGAVESDGFQLLYGQSALWTSVRKAVDVMRRFPGVLTDDALDPHTTFQYLCCLTPAELTEKVFPAMDAVQWAPVRASYAKAVCNVDGSVILLADDATQAQMSAVVEKLEAAIEATGLPVIPRATMQSFHITLGTTNASFPMAEALAAINAAVTDWAPPFDISEFSFFLPVPHTVRAHGAQAAPPHIDNDLQLFNPAAVRRSPAASAIVTLNVSEPVADGDFIQVQVDNPEHAARGDFVALFLASAAPEETVPLKWTYMLPFFPGYEVDGRANVSMQVYGVRAPVVFRLFSGTTSAPVLLASSPAVAFADYGAPLHPRVLNGARSGDFAVAWTTDEESANASRPVLRWGVGAAGEYPNAAAAEAAFVRKGDLCGAPATATGWMDLGATVVAQLPGLGAFAGQTVHYALADDERTSDDFSFVVPPQPGANAYPYKFAAFGDLGRGSNDDGITWREYGTPAKNASAWLAKETGLLFVHHFGDLSYACGFLQSWDEYLWMISPFASRNVYLPGYGNHESDAPGSSSWSFYGPANDSGGECGVVTATLLPPPAPASAAAPYYAYASGPVFLVVLSSEHDFTAGSAQLAWLEATLAAVDRVASPFVICSLHRPMYIDSNFDAGPTSDVVVMNLLQQYVEPVTHAAKVTLMLYGHNHRLERISAAFQNKTVDASQPRPDAGAAGGVLHVYDKPRASVHYVAGAAGAAYTRNDCVSQGMPACPEWSEYVVYAHGYLRFTALNATALRFDYVDTDSDDGAIIDSAVIIQDLAQAWA